MDVERSELLLEPGIMIPKELVELLFINFCINPFHIQEAWKIKLFFANPKHVLGIFIDLSKAFDSINHRVFLKKLCRYGIRGNCLELLKDYLTSRNQLVKSNGEQSNIELLDLESLRVQYWVHFYFLFILMISLTARKQADLFYLQMTLTY